MKLSIFVATAGMIVGAGAGALMGPVGLGAGIAAVNVWLAKMISDGKKKSE